jgi:hypothetical protein
VPSSPPITDAYLFFFNALVNFSGSVIIQPVLQYGINDYGGAPGAWTIRSWKWQDKENKTISEAITVYPGQRIFGTITGSDCSVLTHTCGLWKIDTKVDQGNGLSVTTTAQVDSYDGSGAIQEFPQMVAGAFEGYNIASCTDLPPSNSLQFSSTAVTLIGAGACSPQWVAETWSDNSVCTLAPSVSAMTLKWCAEGVTNGACRCPSGLTRCGSMCVDTRSDASNCGGCGLYCGGDICSNGLCYSACNSTSGCPAGRHCCAPGCGSCEECSYANGICP